MSIMPIRTFAAAMIAVSLLFTACSKNADSETVARQFVQCYFVDDDLAGAARLASGSARENLEKYLREIESVGTREPAGDEPAVTATLAETETLAPDQMLYVFRVASDVEVGGMEPVTARLWLGKEGGTWFVSRFVQEE
jgi:hypothetical protein